MTERLRFFAFVATLFSIVAMFVAACVLAWAGKSVEALGISGVLTGLVGLAGVLAGARPNTPPTGSTSTGDVNVNPETK